MKFSEFVALVDDLVYPFGVVKLPGQLNRAATQAGWKASDIHAWLFYDPDQTKPVRMSFRRIAGTLVIPDKEDQRFNMNADSARAIALAIFQRLQQRVV